MDKKTKIIIVIAIIVLALILFGKNLNLGKFAITNTGSSAVCHTDADCSDGSNIVVKCVKPGTTASLCLAPGEGEINP